MHYLKLAHKKYNNLLLTLVLLFILSPFLGHSRLGSLVTSIVYFVIITSIVKLIGKKHFRYYLLIAGLALGLQSLRPLGIPELIPDASRWLLMIGNLVNAALLALPIYWITQETFREEQVTKDTIKGGICVYLLLGYLWAVLYQAVYVLEPTSFKSSCEACSIDLVYYSFITLTSTGYGDILPVSQLARILANLEAMTGTMYPAIFIARLVGLYRQPH